MANHPHTPGPWVAEVPPSSDFVTRRIYGPDDEPIANVGLQGYRKSLDVFTEVANAALIADAPDMREQLESLVRWVMFPTEPTDDAWLQGIIDRCRAARERFGIERAGA